MVYLNDKSEYPENQQDLNNKFSTVSYEQILRIGEQICPTKTVFYKFTLFLFYIPLQIKRNCKLPDLLQYTEILIHNVAYQSRITEFIDIRDKFILTKH